MRLKHLIITLLTITLSSVFADTISAQQNFHFRKGWEYADIDWERSAFYEWEKGMDAGEVSSTVMVAACYMREYGVGRNVSKGVSILENLASKNVDVALFTANFWFPILDNDSFVNYKPHAGGQYNFWAMASWWKEPDLKSTTFGLESNYNKVIKYAKMYLSKVSTPGYGRSLANDMIGYCYENGLGGVSMDIAKAMEYYSNAGSDKIYSSATNLIKDIDSIEELEKVVSSIKPYLDDDVLSALDKKPNIDGYYDEKDRFIGTYVSKYKQRAANNAQTWLEQNNPYDDPEKFRVALSKEKFIKDEITKIIEIDVKNVNSINSPDSCASLWKVYNSLVDKSIYMNQQIVLLNNVAERYLKIKCDNIISQNGNDYKNAIIELSNLKLDPIVISLTSWPIGRYPEKSYDGSFQYIEDKLNGPRSKWMISYLIQLFKRQSGDWIWNNSVDIPVICNYNNILYGSDTRENARKQLIGTKDNLSKTYDYVKEKELLSTYCNTQNKFDDYYFLSDFYSEVRDRNITFTEPFNSLLTECKSYGIDDFGYRTNYGKKLFEFVKPIDEVSRIKKVCIEYADFIQILEKEDNKTITPEDYTEYLKKYPQAYYKQYCIDGYAMTTADTYTLDTPKEEIKTLLKSGISKGAAKYVKEHTKKSYLKTKSL